MGEMWIDPMMIGVLGVWRRVDRYHSRCQLISYLNVMIWIYILSKDEITRINATICWRVIPCHFSELVVSKDLHHLQSARRTKSSLCVVSSQCFSSCLSLWFAAVWGKLKIFRNFYEKPWPVVFFSLIHWHMLRFAASKPATKNSRFLSLLSLYSMITITSWMFPKIGVPPNHQF